MAKNPIVFALSNPDPEINYELAIKTRKDIIMATGRSDHPNQVNNVLGFPYIFRGALDVRANTINEEMKLASVIALAKLAKEPVPEMVKRAYNNKKMKFGRTYLIPKPLDPRLITRVSPAVAKAAMESGVARKPIEDWELYDQQLHARLGIDQKLMMNVIARARNHPRKIVFTEGDNYKILKAAETIKFEGIGYPVLLGNRKRIISLCKEHDINIDESEILDLNDSENEDTLKSYAQKFYNMRKRKGLTYAECYKLMQSRNYFGNMMLREGRVDALLTGLTKEYSKSLSPAIQIIGVAKGYKKVSGMMIVTRKNKNFFCTDTTVQENPTPEDMVEIIDLTSQAVRIFHEEPKVAVLSYSNFGSAKGKTPTKARKAVELAREKFPDLVIDGDIQANIAINKNIQKEMYPFSDLSETGANTLIFPDLSSGNIAYKLLMELGGAYAVGPILLGMKKPVHIVQLGSSIREIVNIAAVAVIHSQILNKDKK